MRKAMQLKAQIKNLALIDLPPQFRTKTRVGGIAVVSSPHDHIHCPSESKYCFH